MSKPKIVCVIPSIRPEMHAKFVKAWTPLFEKHEVTLITVWDGEKPRTDLTRYADGVTVTDVFSWDSEFAILHRNLFCRFTDACRNIGFVKAAIVGADYILTLDDDVVPKIDVVGDVSGNDWHATTNDPIQSHLDVLAKRVPTSWMNTAHDTDLYLRGVPYGVRDESPVMLSHGVWVGVPDFDGETQLKLETCPYCKGGGKTIINDRITQHDCPTCRGTGKMPTDLGYGLPKTLPYYVGPIPKGVLFPLCFVPTAEVTMADGSRKAISEVSVGDRVFAKGGESHSVQRVMESPHNGDVVKLRVAGRDREVVCTPGHNMWVLRNGSDKPDWVEAGDVTTDDMLATPTINEPSAVCPTNPSVCKLIGYFLADGYYDKYSPHARHNNKGKYKGLSFVFGTDGKKEAIRDCCECLGNLGVSYNLEYPKSSVTVVTTNTCYELVAAFRETYYVGEWSHGKRLPAGVFGWDVASKRALLAAYWAGDGCFSTVERIKGNTQYQCQAKTRSRTMAVQIQLLMQSLGFPANLSRLSPYKQSKESWAVSINGTRAKEFKAFLTEGTLPEGGRRRFDKAFCENGFSYYAVKEVSRVKYDGPVYNLTVEDDHSYLVEGLVAKNCGMNVMIRKEALRDFYFAPMGPDVDLPKVYDGTAALNRFSDIWMGVFLKREFDRLGWACYTGGATVLHTRASDAKKNVEQERLGREWNEWITYKYDDEEIDQYGVEYATSFRRYFAYMKSYADKRRRYADLIRSIQGGGK